MNTHRFALLVSLLGLAAFSGASPAGLEGQRIPSGPPPFIATPDTLVSEMLRLGQVSPEDLVVDLGSGDGRLVIAAAAAGARGVGVEYDAALVELSRVRAREAGVADRARFVHGDIFQTDVSDANVVMLYLSADFNLRLRSRLLAQLRPGSRIVSHGFHMGDWKPDSALTIGSGAGRATLFTWMVPADLDGFWSLQVDGKEPLVIEFRQAYQQLELIASREGRASTDGNGRIMGENVQFVLAEPGAGNDGRDQVFTGEFVDGKLSGSMTTPGSTHPQDWHAVRFTDSRFLPEDSSRR